MSKSTVAKMHECFWAGRFSRYSGMNYTHEKSDNVVYEFWHLLISAGFHFMVDDLVDLKSYCTEGHYSLAVRNGNLSFVYAYEKKHDRTPFIGTDLCYGSCYPGFSNHATQSKSSGRLCIGVEFSWNNETVSVTSFNDKNKSLIACAYHKRKDGYRGKVKKRFTITAKDFRKEMSARKKAHKEVAALKKAGVNVFYQNNYGWFVSTRVKKRTKYYDTTGVLPANPKPKKCKPFGDISGAVEFAKTLLPKKKG